MRTVPLVALVLSSLLLAGSAPTVSDAQTNPARRAVDADAVARLPYPGTVVPGAIEFTRDGKGLTYLKADRPDSLRRVQWKLDLPDGEPRIVARPPGEGDTEANLSREEALRRERQRQRDTGITSVIRAESADVAIIPLGGDLYLRRGEGPLERLTESPDPEIDPKPDASGAAVAFVRDDSLYVIDVKTKKEMRLSPEGDDALTYGLAEFIAQEELDRQTGFWWSPDGQWIAYQETDEQHIPLYTIAHQGGEEYTTEEHRYPFAGAANAKVRLGIVPSTGGPTRWLDLAEGDEEVYLARVAWDGPRALLVSLLDRDQKRLRLVRIERQSGKRTTIHEDTARTWIDLHDDFRPVGDTGQWTWSVPGPNGRRLELRGADGTLVRTLTPEGTPVDALVALDEKRREVWYTSSGSNPTHALLYRVSLDGGEPVRVTPEDGTHRPVVAPNGDSFVDVFSDRQRPPQTSLCDRDGKTLRVLDDAASDSRLKQLDLVPPELVTFQNRDGVTLHGAYYRPRSDALGTPAPLVVMVYGGPTVQTVTDSWALTADLTAQYLAARGFGVWKCDNRGSSRRGQAFQDPVYRKLGVVEVDDQADGVRFITEREKGKLDPRRVGVTGGSYGGYMTLRCLQRAPETFHAGVAVASVTDWDGYDTAYTERYMSTPEENPEGYKLASVLTAAGDIKGHLLLIHGMIDENVHFRHTARLVTALITAGRPFEILPLPGERHSSRRVEDRRYVAERSADFFARSLVAEKD
jgi:dipeptidyl-peptidase-4